MRKIGFWSENEQSKEQKNETTQFKAEKTEAKESVVRVYFPARGSGSKAMPEDVRLLSSKR